MMAESTQKKNTYETVTYDIRVLQQVIWLKENSPIEFGRIFWAFTRSKLYSWL